MDPSADGEVGRRQFPDNEADDRPFPPRADLLHHGTNRFIGGEFDLVARFQCPTPSDRFVVEKYVEFAAEDSHMPMPWPAPGTENISQLASTAFIRSHIRVDCSNGTSESAVP